MSIVVTNATLFDQNTLVRPYKGGTNRTYRIYELQFQNGATTYIAGGETIDFGPAGRAEFRLCDYMVPPGGAVGGGSATSLVISVRRSSATAFRLQLFTSNGAAPALLAELPNGAYPVNVVNVSFEVTVWGSPITNPS